MTKEAVAVSILLCIFLISGLYYAAVNPITSDEPSHITAGYINVMFNDYRFNIEHPPFVKQLSALPLMLLRLNFSHSIYEACSISSDIVKIQEPFLFHLNNNLDLVLFMSRLSNLFIALLLAIFLYAYSKKLNGLYAGILSLALLVLSPDFLAHSRW